MKELKQKEVIQEPSAFSIEQQMLLENERRTNRLAAYYLLVFACLILLICGLSVVHLYSLGMLWCFRVLLPVSLFFIFVFFYVRHLNYYTPSMKLVEILSLVFITGVVYFLYPAATIFFFFGPIILSTRYYNKKLVIQVSLITLLTYIIICVLNMLLEQVSEHIRELHVVLSLTIWSDLGIVLKYYAGPHTITIILASILGINSAINGRKLISETAEAAIRMNAMESDLAMASTLQRRVMPEASFVTDRKEVQIQAFMRPAKDVGGDFYDYFMADENTLCILIADVSDKGLPAAMFMMFAQNIVRFAVQQERNLEKAIAIANNMIIQKNKEGMYVTMWVACIDRRTGVGKYVNAGHPSPIIKHANGSVEWLTNEPDVFLGLFEDAQIQSHMLELEDGASLILYTDGVTDALNEYGEDFGSKRLLSTVQGTLSNCELMCNAITKALRDYVQDTPQFDDTTIAALTFHHVFKPYRRKIQLPARDCTEEIQKNALEILKQFQCPEEEAQNICVGIDEIASNLSDYAYPDGEGEIQVFFSAGNNYLWMEFSDHGVQFNPLEKADPEFGDEPLFGGLGIYLVRSMMDDVSYRYEDGKNILTVIKAWNA